ncbi:MAG: hypothetical protein LUM44_24565 [Pyrinomonadaceae bacterium]|nr:hypothetical protein [Pyrinomonadaceae bacterium]
MNNLQLKLSGGLFLILLSGIFFDLTAQTDKRIEHIRKLYRETNEKIAEANENGEYSSVYLTEMVVNKNNGSYPAVGIFQTTYRFYYTYGDREKNPYPNRLLKIGIETKRSANIEKYEFLFNEKEQLVFYFEAENTPEKRIYFENELAIKAMLGDKNLEKNEVVKTSKSVLAEKRKLSLIFQSSLDY